MSYTLIYSNNPVDFLYIEGMVFQTWEHWEQMAIFEVERVI